MRKMKWIFYGYLTLVALIIVGIAVSFAESRPRQPDCRYDTYPAAIKTLDPAACNDETGISMIGQTYECLYNYKFGVKPYEIFPEIAADLPRVSEDGLTYTIKIRPGIRFYDPQMKVFPGGVGPEIKAKDVVYSFKRVADQQVGAENYSTLFQGRVEGIDDFFDYTSKAEHGKVDYDRPVAGLQAIDDSTVRIKLAEPNPQFIYLLAYTGTAIVSRDAVETYGDDFPHHMVGTGPYALVDYKLDQRIVFDKNPIYRGRPDIDGNSPIPADQKMPFISRLQFDFMQDDLPLWYLFEEKYYDISGIPKETYAQAIDAKTRELLPKVYNQGIRLAKAEEPGIYYYGFNMRDEIVGKNKPLRQAMCLAYDRKKYIEIYRNGRGTVPNSPIPQGFAAYDPNLVDPYSELNLDAARQKLKEAEQIYGGKIPKLKLYMPGTETAVRQEAEFFVSQMKQIGLVVEPQYMSWDFFQTTVNKRGAQIFANGWNADYPDEQTFMQMFYGPFGADDGVNSTAYSNPAVDALYKEAVTMPASPQRAELYRKMIAIVNEDCPWLYQFNPIGYTLYWDWLSKPGLMSYGYGYIQYSRLDSKLRGQMSGRP